MCNDCQEIFKNKVSFNLHRRQKHGEKQAQQAHSGYAVEQQKQIVDSPLFSQGQFRKKFHLEYLVINIYDW